MEHFVGDTGRGGGVGGLILKKMSVYFILFFFEAGLWQIYGGECIWLMDAQYVWCLL